MKHTMVVNIMVNIIIITSTIIIIIIIIITAEMQVFSDCMSSPEAECVKITIFCKEKIIIIIFIIIIITVNHCNHYHDCQIC